MKEHRTKVECRLCGKMTNFDETIRAGNSVYFCTGHTREELKNEIARTERKRKVKII